MLYKYLDDDDGGGNLAALITYYTFASLCFLLLLTTALGLVLRGDTQLQQRVLDSASTPFRSSATNSAHRPPSAAVPSA